MVDREGLFIALGLMLVLGALWSIFSGFAPDIPEYQDGYSQGYSEHNDTKYGAAVEIIRHDCYLYTDEQLNYARGYHAGYLDYKQAVRLNEEAEVRNETVKILGFS